MSKARESSTLARNKRVGFDYEIIEQFEAGLELLGFEVKSLRQGGASLAGSFVTLASDGAWLRKAYIPPYQEKNQPDLYDPYRSRRLLLSKGELSELIGKEKEKGLAIVPISLYNKERLIKAKIAIVRGKKTIDKRQTIKRRDEERRLSRELKRNVSL